MADGKRSGSGGGGGAAGPKVAVPKTGAAPQGPGDFDEVLTKSIGARVKLTTAAPNSITLEGTIFTACRTTNILAICTTSAATGTSSPSNYHLIPVSRIQSIDVLSLPSTTNPEEVQQSISRVDLKALKTREAAAIKKIKERDASKGKGVTREAQDIFDALARTLPTRWHETSIIVNDAVIIAKPYGPENCTAPKDQQNMLVRIKKVLENERRKLAEKSSKAASAGPAGGVRKGG